MARTGRSFPAHAIILRPVISATPWLFIAPTAQASAQATATVFYPVQQAFPSSDVVITGWTPSSGTSLSAMIGDGSDSTYISSVV